MAKIRIQPHRPASRKQRRHITVPHLMKQCGTLPLTDILKELRELRPSRRVLLNLLSTLQTVQASPEIQREVQRYCQERGCDPSQPPVAKQLHRKPADGDRRLYNVQYDNLDRPFLRLPLDPLGRPEKVLVNYVGERVELAAFVLEN